VSSDQHVERTCRLAMSLHFRANLTEVCSSLGRKRKHFESRGELLDLLDILWPSH
jgi:hypothetical protein